MKRYIIALGIVLMMLPSLKAAAQTRIAGRAEFDRTVHDFGDISLADGPVSCRYNVRNVGSTPLTILSVVSSCGCTDVKWTRETLSPGAQGAIEATFKNEDGPYPFDKSLTVYLSDIKQPVILRLRGVAHEKELPLTELYPVRRGDFAMKTDDIPRINLTQGQPRSGEIMVANVGGAPVNVGFDDVSEGLRVSVSPNPIPAGKTAKLSYTITPDRTRWGVNKYDAVPIVNGRRQAPIHFTAATKEDFSTLTKEEKAAGANPKFDSSVISFNPLAAGKKVEATFTLTNIGKRDFHIYKVDADSDALRTETPADIAPGGKGVLKCTLDTSGMPAGEVRVMVTLTTNSPLRPVINLFVTGFIK